METELTYYPGCSLHGSSKLYDVSVRKVLDKFGVTLKEIDDWSCCGATSAEKTDHRLGIALPARNLGLAQKEGKPVLAPCSSCYSRLVSANVAQKNEPELLKDINKDLDAPYTETVPVKNILELLYEGLQEKDAPKIVQPLHGLKVVPYYGCLLTRIPGHTPSDNVENPVMMDKILKMIGAEPIDWSYKTDCCGASSAVADRPVALNLIKKLLDEAIEAEADAIVTSCPMCQLNLDMYQEQANPAKPLPIYFITELVGIALGLKKEMEKEIKRHFVDGTTLLKNLGLL